MNFDQLGLHPRLVAKLSEQDITTPTPIQQKAIPHAMSGRDVMGLAQTGTGKTAAFGLPLIHNLNKEGTKPQPQSARGLILAPTRELARQITENLRLYTRDSHLKINLIVGGVGINPQINKLRTGSDLLVATPGRLIDLIDRKAVRLDSTHYLVLDEADQMLDLGFIHTLRRIAKLLPVDRQTMLFSATMPKQMSDLAAAYLSDPIRVEAAPPGKPADKITQSLHFVAQNEKTRLLVDYLGRQAVGRSIVFARTKHGAERLMKHLAAAGLKTASIHGNKSQNQRERSIKLFRAGDIDTLVATDVAARGLDIPDVQYVYNYDLPNVPENYIHRIGRTARAGKSGAAIAFCAPAEMDALVAIQKVVERPLEVVGGTAWSGADVAPEKPRRQRRRRKHRSSGKARIAA